MNKAITAILMSAALMGLSRNALATEYTFEDNNPANVWLNALNPSYNGQFNLTDYGFNPATMEVTSAVAEFTLWDWLLQESFKISVEGTEFASGGSFSGFISLGGNVVGSLLANLNDDGILNYTVTRESGEFWLKHARLTAQAEDSSSSVPDGGATVALLGLATFGLGMLRRKS